MRFFPSLFVSAVIGSLIFSLSPVQAASPIAGLIKCPDIADVYYLAEDGSRYVFPNEDIYHSWYENFTGVKIVSCQDIARFPLGGLVPYQAGSKLIKADSLFDMYAVEPEGMLRSITDVQANVLYGSNWKNRLVTLSDSLFNRYKIGDALADGEIPVGTVLEEKGMDGMSHFFRAGTDEEILQIDYLFSVGEGEVLKQDSILVSDLEARLNKTLTLTRIDGTPTDDQMESLFESVETIHVPDDHIFFGTKAIQDVLEQFFNAFGDALSQGLE